MGHPSFIWLCYSFKHELQQQLQLLTCPHLEPSFVHLTPIRRFFVPQSCLVPPPYALLLHDSTTNLIFAFGYAIIARALGCKAFQPQIRLNHHHLLLSSHYLILPLSYPWWLFLHYLIHSYSLPLPHLHPGFHGELALAHELSSDDASFYGASYGHVMRTIHSNIQSSKLPIPNNCPFLLLRLIIVK